jgi:ferredoxin
MACVITRLCRDCVDGACVDVCPVDAIVEHRPECGTSDLPRQLFINPDECICCNLCAPECPWEAIFDESDVPAPFRSDIELNAVSAQRREEFHVPVERLGRGASANEVLQNKARWGLLDPSQQVSSLPFPRMR